MTTAVLWPMSEKQVWLSESQPFSGGDEGVSYWILQESYGWSIQVVFKMRNSASERVEDASENHTCGKGAQLWFRGTAERV